MSLFLATCQGIGLAVAAGTFAGASGRRGPVGVLVAAPAAIGGGILFGLAVNRGHPAWPGGPLGTVIALFALEWSTASLPGRRPGAGRRLIDRADRRRERW